MNGACLSCEPFLHILLSRDQGAGDKMNPFAEQEAWEDHQIGKFFEKFSHILLFICT